MSKNSPNKKMNDKDKLKKDAVKEEDIKRESSKEKNKSKHNKNSFYAKVEKIDERKKVIIAFAGGLLLGLIILFIVYPERIAKLKDDGSKDKNAIKDTRGAFMLPEKVVSVVGVYEIGGFEGEAGWGGMLLGKHTGDISLQNLLYQNAYDRSLAVAADTTSYYIATESFLDIYRQIFQHPITFRYNRLTNNLRFLGELPRKDVIVDVLVAIPDCDMYNDDLFRRYVMADCKANLGRVLGTFNYQLPGNISINVEQIANEGNAEKDAILQEIKDMSGSWYIMTF